MSLDHYGRINDSHLRWACACVLLAFACVFAVGVLVGALGYHVWLDWTAAGGWLG